MVFVNRSIELSQLDRLYQSHQAELFVLYGRRRVGKTELLREFCKDKPHLFFIATLGTDSEQLAIFSQQVYAAAHSQSPAGFTYPSWDAAFQALAEIPSHPKPLVIIDEFTYLISGNKAIPSILQKAWDQTLKDRPILLILCGSYIGMMETEVLGYQAPLYGRRTASTLLQPLDPAGAALFFPEYKPEEQFTAWAVLGGMPYYLRMFTDQRGLFENIREKILDPQTGPLFSEPQLLLMEELREPRNYFSILRAIAQGRTRLSEISQASGVGPVTTTARYLDILQQMRLVTRRVPTTEHQPEKSKKGLYQIEDHFLRFWFRYLQPNLAGLHLGLADSILEQRIRPDFDQFAALPFEEAAQLFVARQARDGQLPFLPERIGGWWERDAEIDVLAINTAEQAALVGECKWSVNLLGTNVLEDLKRKTAVLLREGWLRADRIQYMLFARSGFTPALKAQAQQEGVALYTIEQMYNNT